MYDPNDPFGINALFPGLFSPVQVQPDFGPSSPFLGDDWRPDRQDAYRAAALQAGLSLLGAAPSGQWSNFAPAIGAGAQAFRQDTARQRDDAQRRQAWEWEQGQRSKEKWNERLDAAREKREERLTEQQRITDHRTKLKTLPEKYRPLVEPFVGEANFEERLARAREMEMAEQEKAEKGPEAKTYAGYSLIPDEASPSGYRAVEHPGIPKTGGGPKKKGRRFDDLPKEKRTDETREQIRPESALAPRVAAIVSSVVPPDQPQGAIAQRIQTVLERTPPGQRAAVLMQMLEELKATYAPSPAAPQVPLPTQPAPRSAWDPAPLDDPSTSSTEIRPSGDQIVEPAHPPSDSGGGGWFSDLIPRASASSWVRVGPWWVNRETGERKPAEDRAGLPDDEIDTELGAGERAAEIGVGLAKAIPHGIGRLAGAGQTALAAGAELVGDDDFAASLRRNRELEEENRQSLIPQAPVRSGAEGFTRGLVESLPTTAAVIGTGAVAGPLAGAAAGGLLAGSESYETARELGAGKGKAAAIGLGVGAGSAALERVGLEKVLRGTGSPASRLLTSAVAEGTTEGAQESLGIGGELVAGRGFDLDDDLMRVGQAALGGAILGPAFTGGQMFANRNRSELDFSKPGSVEAGILAHQQNPDQANQPREAAWELSPDAEATIREMREGSPPESRIAAVVETARALRNRLVRQYEDVDQADPRNADFLETMRQQDHAAAIATEKTVRLYKETYSALGKDGQRLFDEAYLFLHLEELVDQKGYTDALLPGNLTRTDVLRNAVRARENLAANPDVAAALEQNRAFWRQVRQDYAAEAEKRGINSDWLFSDGDFYIHHAVMLDHLQPEGPGTSTLVKDPGRPGFSRRRKGGEHLFSLRFDEAYANTLATLQIHTARMRALNRIEANYSEGPQQQLQAKQEEIRAQWNDQLQQLEARGETQAAGNLREKLRGLRWYSPEVVREVDDVDVYDWTTRGLYQQIFTVPDQVATQAIQERVAELAGEDVSSEWLRRGDRPPIALPAELAATLKKQDAESEGGVTNSWLAQKANQHFKRFGLFSPQRLPRYVIRNFVGDVQIPLLINPGALQHGKKASQDILGILRHREVSPEMQRWVDLGGMVSGESVQEIALNERTRLAEMAKQIGSAGPEWQKVAWKWARRASLFDLKANQQVARYLESLTRYSVYLDYRQQLERNEAAGKGLVPDNYGASRRDVVDALEDIDEKAFKLANELVGAYDQVGQVSRWARRTGLVPFVSFQDANTRRFVGVMRNMMQNPELMGKVARGWMKLTPSQKARSGVAVGAYGAVRMGQAALFLHAIEGLMALWNHGPMEEAEKLIPEHQKKRAHVNLGVSADGKIPYYFTNPAVMSDFKEWFGVDEWIYGGAVDVWTGRRTAADVIKDQALTPVRKMVNALGPITAGKLLYEVLTGKSLFPDPLNPRPIRDRGEYLAATFGLDRFYRMGRRGARQIEEAVRPLTGHEGNVTPPALSGQESTGIRGALLEDAPEFLRQMWIPGLDPLAGIPYTAQAGEIAMSDTWRMYRRYLEQSGQGGAMGGGNDSRKTQALREYKRALRVNDETSATQWLVEYYRQPGTSKASVLNSIRSMHPLAGMSREERGAFLSSLSVPDRERAINSLEYWQEEYGLLDEEIPAPEEIGLEQLGIPTLEMARDLQALVQDELTALGGSPAWRPGKLTEFATPQARAEARKRDLEQWSAASQRILEAIEVMRLNKDPEKEIRRALGRTRLTKNQVDALMEGRIPTP